MNRIQSILVKIGRKDLAQKYYLAEKKFSGLKKIAGEIRFIKDKGNDSGKWWAYNNNNNQGLKRELKTTKYKFDAANTKVLNDVWNYTMSSLNCAMSAYEKFAKLNSYEISPDGSLGGKGYIQKISDMRRNYMNTIEALSSISDTLYDEMNGPHWRPEDEEIKNEEGAENSDPAINEGDDVSVVQSNKKTKVRK